MNFQTQTVDGLFSSIATRGNFECTEIFANDVGTSVRKLVELRGRASFSKGWPTVLATTLDLKHLLCFSLIVDFQEELGKKIDYGPLS